MNNFTLENLRIDSKATQEAYTSLINFINMQKERAESRDDFFAKIELDDIVFNTFWYDADHRRIVLKMDAQTELEMIELVLRSNLQRRRYYAEQFDIAKNIKFAFVNQKTVKIITIAFLSIFVFFAILMVILNGVGYGLY